jgi:hypothetical protein
LAEVNGELPAPQKTEASSDPQAREKKRNPARQAFSDAASLCVRLTLANWRFLGRCRKRVIRHSLKHGSLVFNGIATGATVVSAIFFFKSLQYSNESLRVALNGYQRGYADHLSARYAFSGDEEYLVVTNSGLMPASAIRLRRVPYFVFSDKAISVKGLGVELLRDASLFSKLRIAGIAQSPRDYLDLMGPDREISISELTAQDQTQVEVSRSSNQNGIRVANALGGIFIVDWIVTFNSGPENVQTSQNLEFWLSHANTRESLTDESWGPSVAKRIEDAASSSKDYLLEVEPWPPAIPSKKHR